MPVPSFHLLPTFQKKRDFRFSPDQRCESSGLSHIKATIGTTFPKDLIHSNRLSNTSECLGSQVLAIKIALNQSRCCVTDHKRIGLSQSLKTSSNVWRFTQRELFLTPCSAHFTDDDYPSVYPEPDRQCDAFFLLQP